MRCGTKETPVIHLRRSHMLQVLNHRALLAASKCLTSWLCTR